jgi:Lamin Tail Domain/Bacterial Ig-like domain/Secretion system C-terminal sorting domain/Endonuclease/Exonuclease/phosphatase family/Calx-beta domain
MKKICFLIIISIFLLSCISYSQTYYNLSSGTFIQNWSNTGLITANDNWSGVPGIQGFLGQDITTTTGTDPQTLTAVSALANDLDVIANQSSTAISNGGVAEFDGIANPTIALQGSGTADAPYIVIYLNTTGVNNIRVQYNLRDIDGTTDNAIQPVALQYRIGNTGSFTNLPAGFVSDATSGPSLATLVTAVDVTLPAACENQSQVEIRIITSNAVGNDEWVGIDDINISSGIIPTNTVSVSAGNNAAEGSTEGTFNITLSGAAPAGGVTINYTLNGTAANTDYTDPDAGSISIAEGNSSGTITLTATDDLLFEGTETISITLNSATNGFTIGTGTASINLLDNDVAPTASVAAGINAAEPVTNGTLNITLSSPAPAGGVTIAYSLSGTATINTDYSDPLNGTITIAEGNTTGTITFNTIDDIMDEGTETILITLNNATNGYTIGTGTAFINLLDNDAPPVNIVINEVYGGGGNSGATYKNDFIELYNNGNTPVSLAGWSVQYNSAAGTGSWQVTTLSGSIPAHGYYLIQEAIGTGGTTNLPAPDATGSIAMAAAAGKVALANNTTPLSGQNPSSAAIIDKVAYGIVTGGGFEGAGSAPAPANTTSVQRNPTGFDTNNNNTDFITGLPTPKNSVTDITPPTAFSLFPANTATDIATAFTAVITFNEIIEKGIGNITLKKTSDGSTVQTINVAASEITVSGNTVSFLIQSLEFATSYYFEISSGAFRDLAANDFAGFSGSSGWSFTTTGQPIGTIGTTYSFNTCSSTLPDGFSFFSALGPQIWGCTTFGRDAANLPSGSAPNGVQINGFNVTNIPNIDWLISPSFDLTGTTYPLLAFWSRTAFNGLPLQLKVSTDYINGDPTLATWTDINGRFPSQTSNIWTLSSDINLSAFKQSNVHFAFVYISSDDEGARWTLDDISIVNSLTPPPPSLTVGTTDIQYTFVANGSTADKTFTFIGNDLTGDVTLNSTGDFLLSKDGNTFSSTLLYTVAEANNISKTVYVRFAPTQSNQNFTGTVEITTSGLSAIVNLTGTSIDPVTTLEVVNWNMEWFGSADPTLGPVNKDLQEQNATTILQSIGADLYGLVEVVDESRLAHIVSQMPGYSYVICNYGSHTNTNEPGASPLSQAQKEAFVYKTSIFSNITTAPLLSQGINSVADLTNPAYNYWSSGRFPFMMNADVTLNCVTKNVRFVLVHAKANTSPTATAYSRRKSGADTLHYTLNQLYPNDNIIILGDFNDDLDQSITAGFTTTSWDAFTTDEDNFSALTLPLSLAGKKSTVSFNDVIDHVVASNEIEPYYMSSTASILTDVSSLVSNYGSTTSDHFPVFTRYIFPNTTAPSVTSCTSEVAFCMNSENTYSIPAFTATDDCDAVTYSYVITGSTDRSGTSNNASGIFNIGTSTIMWTATDSWGNTNTCQTTVVINENPTVTVNSATRCSNDPAVTITATPSPAGIYNYTWTVPAGATDPGNVASFSTFVAGTYNVVITNPTTGCTGDGSGILIVNANPTVAVNSPTKCANDPAATISATPSPAGVYNYAWTVPAGAADPGNTASFSATVAGTYNVVITNPTTGCTGNGSGILTVNANPTVIIPDAYALSTGVLPNTVYIGYTPASSLTLLSNVSGGVTPYSYNWSNGSIASSITVSPTTNTTYNLTVTDANGCNGTATKTISVIDIRGGKKLDQVKLCHKGNSVVVPKSDVPDHLAHGDMLGNCIISVSSVKNVKEENSSVSKLVLYALPNPSATDFTINIQSGNASQKISLRVIDILGRTIEKKDKLQPNSTLKIGNNYYPGIYIVEITQGINRKQIKLIKTGK